MITTNTLHGIEYLTQGKAPKLLILSGMHGDESGVIECLVSFLNKSQGVLPDYVCIPRVSPSAVLQQTRKNLYGHDVNREFRDPPKDVEIQAVMDILQPYRFDICMDFHEDSDRTSSMYIYDSHQISYAILPQVQRGLEESGATLYSGIDDPMDADLGYTIEHGYLSVPIANLSQNAGFSTVWLAKHNIIKRMLTIEVPGKAPVELKAKIVEAVFTSVLPQLLIS